MFESANKMLGWIDENGKDLNSDRFTWKTIGQGAATHVVAAFDPSIVGVLQRNPVKKLADHLSYRT